MSHLIYKIGFVEDLSYDILKSKERRKYMKNTLEKLINDSNSREIKLKGEINLIVENSNVISIGKGIVRKIITINLNQNGKFSKSIYLG